MGKLIILCRICGLFLSAQLLTGCALWQTLTFQKHTYSRIAPTDITLSLYNPRELTKAEQDYLSPKEVQDTKAIADMCGYSKDRLHTLAIGAVAGAAIVAGTTLALNIIGDEIGGYIEKQKGEFIKSFYAKTTHESFLKRVGSNYELAFDCLVVKQLTQGKKPGLDLAVRLYLAKDETSIIFVPTYYAFSRSVAKTDATGAVDIDVKVTMTTVSIGEKNERSIQALSDQTISFLGVKLPSSADDHSEPRPTTDRNLDKKVTGSWFPFPIADPDRKRCSVDAKCDGILPVTVAVTISETGTGAPDFGTANKEIGDSTKILSDGISKIIDAYVKEGQKK